MNSQVEQTAVDASQPDPRSAARPVPVLAGVQLRNLSIEHAAIAIEVSDEDRSFVIALAKGMRLPSNRVTALKKRTRMSRVQLAVLGYQLSAQERIDWKAAA